MYKIADCLLDLDIRPDWLHERFTGFASQGDRGGIVYQTVFDAFEMPQNYIQCVSDPSRSVWHGEAGWLLLRADRSYFPYALQANEDFTVVRLHITPESLAALAANSPSGSARESVRILLLRALMELFRVSILSFGGICLHAVLLGTRKGGLAFSAPSGTGKTTHTNFWLRDASVRLINGDNCALRVQDRRVTAYGLPWSGSSEAYHNQCVPFLGTVFIERAGVNEAFAISREEALLRYLQRCFLPAWGQSFADKALETIAEITRHSKAYVLRCRPEMQSVEVLKRCLGL